MPSQRWPTDSLHAMPARNFATSRDLDCMVDPRV
jgi:hypothetical protein